METPVQFSMLPSVPAPWNKGRLTVQKPPLKLKEIWAIRIRLQLEGRTRDLALFNLAIDSKLRSCDLVKLKLGDVAHNGRAIARATVIQQKTGMPVRFELSDETRNAVDAWIAKGDFPAGAFLFPSRINPRSHITTRQYSRILTSWIAEIGLDPADYGTPSLRRTKATLIYRRTKNLRAVQLLLGYRKLESTVRYLSIEVEDALEIAEQTES
jgi:integrase